MAFDKQALKRTHQVNTGAGANVSFFDYATLDTQATLRAASYFTDKRLNKGDVIRSVTDLGTTPTVQQHVVTAVVAATGVATIVLQTIS